MNKELTIEQYLQKLRKIIDGERSHREYEHTKENEEYKSIILAREQKMYDAYCRDRTDNDLFSIREVDLVTEPFYVIGSAYNGYFCDSWIMLNDFKKYMIKCIVPDRQIIGGNSNIVIQNAMVIPKIIRAMGCESAEYYITNWWKEDDLGSSTEQDTFIATPSFLKKGEELISLYSICEEEYNSDISEIEQKIKTYASLRKERYGKEQIDRLVEDFIKLTFISKFIENCDERSQNMSIIVDDKSIRMAPLYDYDYCCGNQRIRNIERTINGKKDLASFIEYYMDRPWFKKWLKERVLTLDLDEVLKQDKNSPNKAIYDEEYYKKIFEKQINLVRNCLAQEVEVKVERELE